MRTSVSATTNATKSCCTQLVMPLSFSNQLFWTTVELWNCLPLDPKDRSHEYYGLRQFTIQTATSSRGWLVNVPRCPNHCNLFYCLINGERKTSTDYRPTEISPSELQYQWYLILLLITMNKKCPLQAVSKNSPNSPLIYIRVTIHSWSNNGSTMNPYVFTRERTPHRFLTEIIVY